MIMNSAKVLELAGDNAFVWISVIGAVVVVGYVWFQYARRSGGRYKR
jgi:hypothetical protein